MYAVITKYHRTRTVLVVQGKERMACTEIQIRQHK